MILGWCYILTLAAVAILAIPNPVSMRLPLLLLPAIVQSFIVIIGPPDSERWLRETWMPCEAIALLGAILSIVVTFLEETKPIIPYRRFWLRMGALAVSAALIGLVWIGIHHEDSYWIFLAIRSRLWQAAAIVLGITWALVPHRVHRDTVLLFVIAAAHALVGPLAGAHVKWAQPAFRLVVIVACLYWIVRGERKDEKCLSTT